MKYECTKNDTIILLPQFRDVGGKVWGCSEKERGSGRWGGRGHGEVLVNKIVLPFLVPYGGGWLLAI